MVFFETTLEDEAIILISKVEATLKTRTPDLALLAKLPVMFRKIHDHLSLLVDIGRKKKMLVDKSVQIIDRKKVIADELEGVYAQLKKAPTRELVDRHSLLKKQLHEVILEQENLARLMTEVTDRYRELIKQGRTDRLSNSLLKISNLTKKASL
jgi:hypothetical protein